MDMRLFKIILILLLAVSAWAGPLDRGDLPGSARWVIHVDGQALWASELGTQLRQIADAHAIQAKLAAIKTLFGTDLTADVHSVTLFGPDGDEKQAVALIKGRMDQEKLISVAVLNPRYEKILLDDSEMHRWHDADKKKTNYMGFASDHALIISQSQSAVSAAMDVLAGKADSAQGSDRFGALTRAPDKAFVVVCAEDLSDITQGQAKAAMLQRSSVLALFVGEEDGVFSVTLELETDSPEAAVQIESMGRGILAMMQFQDGKFTELKPLVAACSLTSRGKRVEFAFRYPLGKLVSLAKPHIFKQEDQE